MTVNYTLALQEFLGQQLIYLLGSPDLAVFIFFIAVAVLLFLLSFAADFRIAVLLFAGALLTIPVSYGGLGIISNDSYIYLILAIGGAILGLAAIKLGGMK